MGKLSVGERTSGVALVLSWPMVRRASTPVRNSPTSTSVRERPRSAGGGGGIQMPPPGTREHEGEGRISWEGKPMAGCGAEPTPPPPFQGWDALGLENSLDEKTGGGQVQAPCCNPPGGVARGPSYLLRRDGDQIGAKECSVAVRHTSKPTNVQWKKHGTKKSYVGTGQGNSYVTGNLVFSRTTTRTWLQNQH